MTNTRSNTHHGLLQTKPQNPPPTMKVTNTPRVGTQPLVPLTPNPPTAHTPGALGATTRAKAASTVTIYAPPPNDAGTTFHQHSQQNPPGRNTATLTNPKNHNMVTNKNPNTEAGSNTPNPFSTMVPIPPQIIVHIQALAHNQGLPEPAYNKLHPKLEDNIWQTGTLFQAILAKTTTITPLFVLAKQRAGNRHVIHAIALDPQ